MKNFLFNTLLYLSHLLRFVITLIIIFSPPVFAIIYNDYWIFLWLIISIPIGVSFMRTVSDSDWFDELTDYLED